MATLLPPVKYLDIPRISSASGKAASVNQFQGGLKMKTRTFVSILILVLAVLIIVGSCATMKSPDKLTYERFCGTWANQDYESAPGVTKPYGAKIIINPDGTFVMYEFLNQTGFGWLGTYTVEKRWTDTEGNYFYHLKIYKVLSQGTQYELFRLDKTNSYYEANYSNVDYPSKIDPKDMHSSYHIFYRY